MNFFGVGPLEIMLIMAVAVIVLGPERLPEAAVQLARAVRHLRGYATSATQTMRTELEDLTREYEQMRREVDELRRSVRKDFASVTDQVNKILNEPDLKDPLPELKEPIAEPGGEPPPEFRKTNGQVQS
jgi:sec-independent protein translocase protein TatB